MLPWVLRYGRRTPFVWNFLLLPQKTMKKSEPMLVGDIIRQMLSDPRIKALIDDYGMMGLGTYIYLRNSFDAHFNKGLPHDYLIRVVAPLVSRNRVRNVLLNYGLFSEDEFGLLHVCDFSHDHAMPAHGSPAHGSPAHGMHGTDENNINLNNNISVADQSMKARCRFQKPSVEEVDAYCRQRQNHVDASRFCDFYESKGWKVGKSKMVDWKAAVRTWERSDGNHGNVAAEPQAECHAVTSGTVTSAGGIQYYNGRPLPPDAPPRPSASAEWDESSQSWFDLYR